MWQCTFCEQEIPEEKLGSRKCPHADCDVVWCGDECCGAQPEWIEEKGDLEGDPNAEKKTAG